MDKVYIKILDARVMKILEGLEDLKLIKIHKTPGDIDPSQAPAELSSQIGSDPNSAPPLKDITKEAENMKDPGYTNK